MTSPSSLNVNLNTAQFATESADFPQNLSGDELINLLKMTTELAADEVFWMTSDSAIIYANRAACEKLGYAPKELIGKKVWEWDPLFPKEVWPTFWQELKDKKNVSFETQHQNKHGEVFPVRIKGHFIQNGKEELLFAFVSDISEIKKHELKLKQRTEKVEALLEHEKRKFEEFVNLAPVGIAINEMESGKFDYINEEFSRFSGYSVEELNNMDYWELTPIDYADQEQKQLASMAEKGRYGPYQKEYIHKDGHTFPVLLSGIKITEVTGKNYIWSVVQDISRQIENEQALQSAKEKADASSIRMKLANDSAGIGIWEWNLCNDDLIWDDWMYTLYGISKNRFSGAYEAWESSVHPDDIDDVKANLNAAVVGNEKYEPEFRIVRPDGQVRTMKASAEVIKNEAGTAMKVIGVNYDITEKIEVITALQKAKIEAENASKAKSDFLANMSHEIRTPMNAILGGLQILQKTELDEHLNTILNNASYSAKSLLRIIADILDYSKIESNKLELEHAPFSLIEVLESVKYELNSMVSAKNIELIITIDDNFVDGWEGDLVRVKQILLNLASNAVKFTEKGSVKITLSCCQFNRQRSICIKVVDSGIGMNLEAQNRIFERFSQADTSTTRKYGGTGLGMSITVSLIQMMKGTINLESILGKGTSINVILPLKHTPLETSDKINKSVSAPNMLGKRILIAEDNEINQAVLHSMLTSTEAHLTTVANGQLAVEATQNEHFDLVLMDIHMPEMDGLEAQKKINQMKPDLPIIAVTANTMVEEVESYLQQGFVTHIGKPIDMDTLYGVLSHYS